MMTLRVFCVATKLAIRAIFWFVWTYWYSDIAAGDAIQVKLKITFEDPLKAEFLS